MRKVLFIVNQGNISLNANGGASVYYSHLELLYASGYTIEILAVQWTDNDVFKEEDYKEVKQFVSAVKTYKIINKTPTKGFNRLCNAIFKPEIFEYYFLNNKNISFLKKHVSENNFDLVFGDWRWAGIWACFSFLKTPVIYAHHDWEYKLAKLRSKRNLLGRFHTFQKKRVEYKMVKGVAGSISGSFTETKEIEKISSKKAIYIPTTYSSVLPKLIKNDVPRIVHLGGMGTTANRLGLEQFLDVSWKSIKDNFPAVKLQVIGSLKAAPESLLKKLKEPNIICSGFVKDLQLVLRPEDIHIIPWEYNTGTRTRIPVIFNYQQALVAISASVEAFPEIKHNKNAVLCKDLKEMSNEVSKLIGNKSKRQKISKEAKETFLTHYTSKSHISKLKEFIEELLL
jgi:glycosyltransferase involved in cell wall biosynthesis